ncbi:hypothetical protein [Microbacterium sp. ZOR0019]|uniref:hypothetical protein n=1 Tax=Microbacterium sp. ZOR0019 TaxID=1339233 RepID=UPI000645EF4C|nr:hypothetical protein [Microbacterium sp. ZOR0019]
MTGENTPKKAAPKKNSKDWGRFLDHKATPNPEADEQPKKAAPEIPEGVAVTPIRGLPTTAWKGQYYRLPLETPELIKEGKGLAAAKGVRVTNAQIVAEGVRLWVERERKRK